MREEREERKTANDEQKEMEGRQEVKGEKDKKEE
jgi:hypothetical protein